MYDDDCCVVKNFTKKENKLFEDQLIILFFKEYVQGVSKNVSLGFLVLIVKGPISLII